MRAYVAGADRDRRSDRRCHQLAPDAGGADQELGRPVDRRRRRGVDDPAAVPGDVVLEELQCTVRCDGAAAEDLHVRVAEVVAECPVARRECAFDLCLLVGLERELQTVGQPCLFGSDAAGGAERVHVDDEPFVDLGVHRRAGVLDALRSGRARVERVCGPVRVVHDPRAGEPAVRGRVDKRGRVKEAERTWGGDRGLQVHKPPRCHDRRHRSVPSLTSVSVASYEQIACRSMPPA